MAENSRYGEFYGYKAQSDLWQEIDDFTYQTPTAPVLLQLYHLEILSLLFWMMSVFVLLNYSNRKMKPLHG